MSTPYNFRDPATLTLTTDQLREAMGRGYEHHRLAESELLNCLRAAFNAERCLYRLAKIAGVSTGQPQWGPRLEDVVKERLAELEQLKGRMDGLRRVLSEVALIARTGRGEGQEPTDWDSALLDIAQLAEEGGAL